MLVVSAHSDLSPVCTLHHPTSLLPLHSWLSCVQHHLLELYMAGVDREPKTTKTLPIQAQSSTLLQEQYVYSQSHWRHWSRKNDKMRFCKCKFSSPSWASLISPPGETKLVWMSISQSSDKIDFKIPLFWAKVLEIMLWIISGSTVSEFCGKISVKTKNGENSI